MPTGHVFVLGGTGIPAPAFLALAARGHDVGILARGRDRLDAMTATVLARGGAAQGWTGPAGAGHWRTPEVVSGAVLTAADGPRREILLGRVRPWAERPH